MTRLVVAKTAPNQSNSATRPLVSNATIENNRGVFLAGNLAGREFKRKMALENVKKMQESTEQYQSFVDTELESLDSYVAALNASESKQNIYNSNNSSILLRL